MAELYTTTEQKIIRELYPTGGTRAVILAGVDRSPKSIHEHARLYGIRCFFRGKPPNKIGGPLTLNGVLDTVGGHARRRGLKVSTVYHRIARLGWPQRKALTTPTGKYDMTKRRAK